MKKIHPAQNCSWLLLLFSLPATHKTARVAIWRKLQNSGFRLTLAGGADYPCVDGTYALKTPRTRFYLDGEATYDKWLEALRLGHVVVTLAAGDSIYFDASLEHAYRRSSKQPCQALVVTTP